MSGIHVPVFVLALLVSGGCTASRASSLSPYVADAASADADCPHSDAGPVARPGPCGSHSAGPARDGGVWACASSADCLDGGLYSPLYAINCLAGACVFDGCLSDADCKTGQACACPYEFLSGWRALGNACISTGCRTNSDCPASEVCSPSVDRYCGGIGGYYCHSSADTCVTDEDCCGASEAGPIGCSYDEALGHFACVVEFQCAG